MLLKGIRSRYRRIQRLREIIRVLIKHGFEHLVKPLKLQSCMPLYKPECKPEIIRISTAVRARMVLEELGPTFVKFGQILSTRPDMIPPDFIRELQKLQDNVPAFPKEDAEEQIRREFNKPVSELFESFDSQPLAAASIGQVHRAKITVDEEGENKHKPKKRVVDVVVKIQRPDIEDTVELDLEILYDLARLVEKHIPESHLYDPVGIVKEFSKTIRRELDYTVEARNADRFARNFKDSATVHIPRVYWSHTSRRVLTMESIKGLKIDEVIGSKDFDAESRARVVKNISDAFMKQVFEDGFFHGDPHPGNIFVMDNGVIGFMDFGMTGYIDDNLKEDLIDLFIAVIQKDNNRLIDGLLDIGMASDETNVAGFRRDIAEFMSDYYGATLKQVRISDVVNELMVIAIRYRIRLPSNFILLIKTLLTVEGLCRRLDPEFNLVEASQPVVKKLLVEKTNPTYIAKTIMKNMQSLNEMVSTIPRQVNSILSKLQKGELKLDLEHKGLNDVVSEVDVASNRLSTSMIIAALIVGSSLIMQTGRGPLILGFPVLGIIGFIFAGILGIFLVISILRSGRY